MTAYGPNTPLQVNFWWCPDKPLKSHLVGLAIPGSFVFTLAYLPIYALVAPALGFSAEYFGIVPQLGTDVIFYATVLLLPFVCLSRDFAWK